MAVTNLKQKEGQILNHPDMIGTGSIASTDTLATDINRYPQGSTYLDLQNGVLYIRIREEGSHLDWFSITAVDPD